MAARGPMVKATNRRSSRLPDSKDSGKYLLTDDSLHDLDDPLTLRHDQLWLEHRVRSASREAKQDFLSRYSFSGKSSRLFGKETRNTEHHVERFRLNNAPQESAASAENLQSNCDKVPTSISLYRKVTDCVPDHEQRVHANGAETKDMPSCKDFTPQQLCSTHESPETVSTPKSTLSILVSRLALLSTKWKAEKELDQKQRLTFPDFNKPTTNLPSLDDTKNDLENNKGESTSESEVDEALMKTLLEQEPEPTTQEVTTHESSRSKKETVISAKKHNNSASKRKLKRSMSSSSIQYLPPKYSVGGGHHGEALPEWKLTERKLQQAPPFVPPCSFCNL